MTWWLAWLLGVWFGGALVMTANLTLFVRDMLSERPQLASHLPTPTALQLSLMIATWPWFLATTVYAIIREDSVHHGD